MKRFIFRAPLSAQEPAAQTGPASTLPSCTHTPSTDLQLPRAAGWSAGWGRGGHVVALGFGRPHHGPPWPLSLRGGDPSPRQVHGMGFKARCLGAERALLFHSIGQVS